MLEISDNYIRLWMAAYFVFLIELEFTLYQIVQSPYESQSMLSNLPVILCRVDTTFRNLTSLVPNRHSQSSICKDWYVWNTVWSFHIPAYTSVAQGVIGHNSHIYDKPHLVESEVRTRIPCMDSFLQTSPSLHTSLHCTFFLPVDTTAFQMGTGIVCPYQTGIR